MTLPFFSCRQSDAELLAQMPLLGAQGATSAEGRSIAIPLRSRLRATNASAYKVLKPFAVLRGA